MGGGGEDYTRRLAAAETIKSFGNEAYSRGDFAAADRKYTKVRALRQFGGRVRRLHAAAAAPVVR